MAHETTTINFGGADHFVYDTSHPGNLFRESSIFLNHQTPAAMFFLSLHQWFANPDKVKSKIGSSKKHFTRGSFAIDFVIELAKLDKYTKLESKDVWNAL